MEQDLIISRALVEIFNHSVLSPNLAFRGGTALFKLYLDPVRYSEDIDLVQVKEGPIGPVMDGVRGVLNPWLGDPSWEQTEGRVTFRYRFESEDGLPLRLKVEINSREHFSIFEENLTEKKEDVEFKRDLRPLLTRETIWDFDEAFNFVMESLISQLPGEPWRGS